ncbi:P-loop containing nucleoside triphosphate hydrolase protein [Umbelopsis sp. PMI_123]|nr:P-loop containing nucleoside triphosphate hydrolase protein [Umbelopsis sp. PMI_123]
MSMQVAARTLARPIRLLSLKPTVQRLSTISNVATSNIGLSQLGHSTVLNRFSKQRTLTSIIYQYRIAKSGFHTTTKACTATSDVAQVIDTIIAEDTPKNFEDIKHINPLTQQALDKVFKYKEMSKVQEAVLNRLPLEKDIFVKAKTGTGKTLAFLIPALESSYGNQSFRDIKKSVGTSILIVSPTRELAQQIAEEARKLTKFYPLKVHCLVGGESKRQQMRNLDRDRADIVVGTPGRLIDMLRSVRHFKRSCESIQTLILDEADQLLDMGFKDEIQDILREIPENRQTLLFSATLTPQIRQNIVQFALSEDHDLLDTVDPNEINTNLQVKQDYYVAPFADQAAVISKIIANRDSALGGKTMIFLPTTRMTEMYAEVFRQLLGPKRAKDIYELHSKKSQSKRNKISELFRTARPGSVLFTSDVSARGVDYPGVKLVIQVGVPSTREQYIHRLGRTGRAGKDGEGVIILAPFEEPFVRNEVSDLPLVKQDAKNMLADADDAREIIHEAAGRLPQTFISDAYMSFLGYYSSRMPLLNQPRSETLVHGDHFIRGFGVTEVPSLSPNLLAKMGLSSKSRDSDRYRGSRSRSRSDSYNKPRRAFSDRDDDRSRRPRFDRDEDRPRRQRFDSDEDRPKRPRYDDDRSSFSRRSERDDSHDFRRPSNRADNDFPRRRPRTGDDEADDDFFRKNRAASRPNDDRRTRGKQFYRD